MTPEEINPRTAPTPAERPYGIMGVGPVSCCLIVLCVAVAIYSNLGNNLESLLPLFISEYRRSTALLPEVRHGQIWRLVTPVFIHFGPIHLLFNLMWVKDLGTAIERRHGAAYLLALSATLAVTSNLGQYFVSDPIFGGMSGELYGWIGYVWLRGYFHPASGFRVPRQLVLWMLGWFVACLVGIIPHVANAAHGVGLAIGALWGWTAAQGRRSAYRG